MFSLLRRESVNDSNSSSNLVLLLSGGPFRGRHLTHIDDPPSDGLRHVRPQEQGSNEFEDARQQDGLFDGQGFRPYRGRKSICDVIGPYPESSEERPKSAQNEYPEVGVCGLRRKDALRHGGGGGGCGRIGALHSSDLCSIVVGSQGLRLVMFFSYCFSERRSLNTTDEQIIWL